jgi:hypothetical protein
LDYWEDKGGKETGEEEDRKVTGERWEGLVLKEIPEKREK